MADYDADQCVDCGGDGECKSCRGEGLHVDEHDGSETCLRCRGSGACDCVREGARRLAPAVNGALGRGIRQHVAEVTSGAKAAPSADSISVQVNIRDSTTRHMARVDVDVSDLHTNSGKAATVAGAAAALVMRAMGADGGEA